MAISFPLSLAQFLDGIGIAETTFDLSEALEVTETGGGQILVADYGPRLWEGSITVRAENHNDADRVVARAELLRQAGASFFVTRTTRLGPQADPGGAILGAATPSILTLAGNNRDMGVTGLPPGYVLTQGDLLSFTYGSPTRHALHRVIATVTANGSGNIPDHGLEVSPALRPGASIGTALKFLRPFCKAVTLPGSFTPQSQRSTRSYGYSFRWRQTLR